MRIFSTVRRIVRVVSGGGGGINTRAIVDVGIRLAQRFRQSGTRVTAGVRVEQGPVSLTVPTAPGVGVTSRVSGTATVAQSPAVGLSQRMALARPSVPQKPAAKVVQVRYALSHRSGATTVAEEAIGGRTDWASDANATARRDGALATIAGSALGARGGRLVLGYANFTGKSDLTITQVLLKFYTRQQGTVLNNGIFRHRWRKVAGGAWTDLETFTGNFDALAEGAERTYDITASITGWPDLDAVETAVEFESALGEIQTGAADAVELLVFANVTDVL